MKDKVVNTWMERWTLKHRCGEKCIKKKRNNNNNKKKTLYLCSLPYLISASRSCPPFIYIGPVTAPSLCCQRCSNYLYPRGNPGRSDRAVQHRAHTRFNYPCPGQSMYLCRPCSHIHFLMLCIASYIFMWIYKTIIMAGHTPTLTLCLITQKQLLRLKVTWSPENT